MPPDSSQIADDLETADAPMRRHILIVEGDAELAATLQGRLASAGFSVTTLLRADSALATVEQVNPDLVMLDWDLPGVASIDMIGRIRNGGGRHAPRVIVLSTIASEQQVVAGFEAGADDYIVKPYSMAELMARVRAVMRSCVRDEQEGDVLRFQELQICGHDFRLTVRGKPVALRSSEYRLLEFLVRNPERAFSRAHLLDRVWGRDARAEERAIDVTVQRLRKALDRHDCAGYIQTVRSVGYRISAAMDSRDAVVAVD